MLKRETILAIFIAVTALVVAIARPTLPTNHEPRKLTVTTTGEYFSLAESAYIDIELRNHNIAAEDVEATFQTLTASLEQIEIQTIDVFTTYLDIYDNDVQNEDSGYSISNRYRIIVRDLTVLDELLGMLVNDLQLAYYRVHFIYPSGADIRQSALGDALQNARSTAQQIAAETGNTIGNTLELQIGSTYSSTNPDSFNYNYADLATEDELNEVIVRPAPVRTSVSVTVTFELK